jgi:type III restriction enzyme
MPRPTGVPELDRAYAVVQSPDVVKTAKNLCDNLVDRCGFDAETVQDAFRVHRSSEAQAHFPVATIPISTAPPSDDLPTNIRGKVRYDRDSGTLHVSQPLTREETVALRDSLETLTDQAAVEEYWQSERPVGSAAKKLDEYAEPLRVPQLVVQDGVHSYLFEPEELEEYEWNLDRCDTSIRDAAFSVDLNIGDRVSVGVTSTGGVRIGGVEEVIVRQLTFVAESDDWTKTELVRWLDTELHRGGALAGLPKAQSQAWLLRVVDTLLTDRGADLRILVRKRHQLANVVIGRIAAHGRQQVRRAADALIDNRSPRRLVTLVDRPHKLEEQDYAPYRRYRGILDLSKHAFTVIADMNDEESQCAKRINDHSERESMGPQSRTRKCPRIQFAAFAGRVLSRFHSRAGGRAHRHRRIQE